MKFRMCVLLCVLLSAGLVTVGYSQSSTGSHKGTQPIKKVIRGPLDLEKFIFDKMKLSPSQRAESNRLLDHLASEIKSSMGLGLAPQDPKKQAKKLRGFRQEYIDGIKRTLTAKQYKDYTDLHVKLRAAIKRSQSGMHF